MPALPYFFTRYLFLFIFPFIFLLSASLLPSTLQAEEAYWEYTFKPGDTIWALAKTHTTTVKNWLAIQQINNIPRGPDRRIKPGTRIKIPVSMLKMQPAPAVVMSTSAGVILLRANDSKTELANFNKLFSGDTIITSADQFVSLRFADSSVLNIMPHSSVTMDALSQFEHTGMIDTRIRVKSGSIDTRVNKQLPGNRYEIITPSAVTAVRGTRFRVSSDAAEITRSEVSTGEVSVSAGHSQQQVAEGFGVIAEKGKPVSAPIKLLDAPALSFDATQSLQWTALADAASYRYQIAKDTQFSQIIHDTQTQSLSIDLSAMEAGDYFIRLRGIDKNKLEGLDSQLAISIKPAPPEEEESFWPVFAPAAILLLGL